MNSIPLPSLDFIAGLINKCGVFMWVKQKNTEIPVFQIKMESSEYTLIELVKEKLSLKEIIHLYNHQNRSYAILLVRKRGIIENIIIPSFDQRLFGSKKIQFEEWRNKFYAKKLEFVYKYHSK